MIPAWFKTLPVEEVRKALEGSEDVLASEHKKAEALYAQHTNCPNGCGSTMEKHHGGVKFAFSDGNWLIPRCLMKCHACGCVRNPFDGMVVEVGDTSKAKYGDVPLVGYAKT